MDGCTGRVAGQEEAGGKDVDNYLEDFGRPTGLEKVKGRDFFLIVKVSNLKG